MANNNVKKEQTMEEKGYVRMIDKEGWIIWFNPETGDVV